MYSAEVAKEPLNPQGTSTRPPFMALRAVIRPPGRGSSFQPVPSMRISPKRTLGLAFRVAITAALASSKRDMPSPSSSFMEPEVSNMIITLGPMGDEANGGDGHVPRPGVI